MKTSKPFHLFLFGILFLAVSFSARPDADDEVGGDDTSMIFKGIIFYVDARDGNDSNDGRSEQRAWKTISRVNRNAYHAGDAILFRRGSLWREQLTLSQSGEYGAPITYGAYGQGSRPVINGSDPVERWIPMGGNIWKSSVASPPEVVYFQGDRGIQKLSLADVNAERTWCWNSGTLFVYASGSPSEVEIPGRSYCIMSEWKHIVRYVVIQNLECRQADRYGIFNNYGGDDWIIEKNVVHHIGGVDFDRVGIMVQGNRTIVRKNTVYQSAANGIDIYSNSTGNRCTDVLVEQNTVYDCVHSHIDLQGSEDAVVRENTITMRQVSTRSMGIFCGDSSEKLITIRPSIYSNLVYNLTGYGIQLDNNTRDAVVYQNTVFNCSAYCYYINNGTNTAILRNNIGCASQSGHALRVLNSGGKTITNNNFFAPGKVSSGAETVIVKVRVNANGDSCDANFNISLDPQFIDTSGNDYRVGDLSPCIGSGMVYGAAKYDPNGILRGNPPDMGAFENTRDRPLFKPSILTLNLPDATQEKQYTSALTVTDRDPGEVLSFIILQGPVWLSINSSGILSGVPAKTDIGSSFTVVIRVVDSHGFSDSLSTTITVLRLNHPPAFITRTLPSAIAGKPYSSRVEAEDPDPEDSLRYKKLLGPEWLNIATDGKLTGTPGLNAGGRKYSLLLSAQDSGGLADTLKANLQVLTPPHLQILSPNGGEVWEPSTPQTITWSFTSLDSVRVEFSSDSGSSWQTISKRTASDSVLVWTVPNTPSAHCLVRVTSLKYPEVTDRSDGEFSIAKSFHPEFIIDTDLINPGCQGTDRVLGLREENLAGFALYAREWKNAKAVMVKLEWDSAHLKFMTTKSSPDITGEELQVNGKTFTPDPEENILGDGVSSMVNQNTPGACTVTLIGAGNTSAPENDGLIYLAIFKILPPFGSANQLTVRTSLVYSDVSGKEYTLDSRVFSIYAMLLPPSNIWVAAFTHPSGYNRVSWQESPSEKDSEVKCYRISRSRSSQITDPVPRTRFSSLDSLFAWEERHTILMDSVSAGITEYVDSVPLNGATYYYWLQTVGTLVESDWGRSEIITSAEENPTRLLLENARPNPFNPKTAIRFEIPADTSISLTVYNTLGIKVAVLAEGWRKAGRYTAVWNAEDNPSGVYFYTLRAGGAAQTRKMLLMR